MSKSSLSPFIQQQYTGVYAYAGVTAVRPRLAAEEAIVVWNEDDTFRGVLTLRDIALRPHHLVIDCLREKPVVRPDQSVEEALQLMLSYKEAVLPVVYERGELVGLLHQSALLEHLLSKIQRQKKEKKTTANTTSTERPFL